MTTLAMAKTAPKQLHNDLVQGRTCPAGAARGLESAAAILFLQLIFPDKVPPIAKRLAWMGALSVGAQAAGALVAQKKREEFVQRLRQRGGSMLDKLGHTKSAPMRGGTGPARAAGRPCGSQDAARKDLDAACEDLNAAMPKEHVP